MNFMGSQRGQSAPRAKPIASHDSACRRTKSLTSRAGGWSSAQPSPPERQHND